MTQSSPELDSDLTEVAGFLARRDVPELSLSALGKTAEVVVVAGCAVLAVADAAAAAVKSGAAKRCLLSGGTGHSTVYLRDAVRIAPDLEAVQIEGRSEAEILRDVIHVRHGIPVGEMLLETVSTNCGGNAAQTKFVLKDTGLSVDSMILIQDPTMQRRTHASFERAWRGERAPAFISYAPFVPAVTDTQIRPEGVWSFERFVSLVVGEIPRLTDGPSGYGPFGADFIEHVEVPESVLAAYFRICRWSGLSTRP